MANEPEILFAQPLSDLVEEYCLNTYNDRRKHFASIMVHAKWVWKQNFWNTLWTLRSKYFFIDRTVTPYQLKFPKDAVKVIGVSTDDECGRLHTILRENRMDTTPKAIPPKNACSTCGEDPTVSACINQLSLKTVDVIINGATYQEQIWTSVCPNGDVLEMRRVPVQDFGSGNVAWTIAYQNFTKVISKLDVNPCGCIKNTPENNAKIVNECNCPAFVPFFRRTLQVLSQPYQKFGTAKIDEEDRVIYFSGNVPDQVNVTWKTNGECPGQEIWVPEYAHETITFGTHWRAGALAPNVNRLEVRERKGDYDEAVSKMLAFKDPVIIEEWMDSQMALPKWGNSGTGIYYDHYFPEGNGSVQ